MRGIQSYMRWSHVPDLDTSVATSEDNPFADPKKQSSGKVSVQMPSKDWLCRKLNRLNITLVEGYLSCSSETGGLLKDHSCDQQNPKPSGMGCFPTRKVITMLCHHGVQMPLI